MWNWTPELLFCKTKSSDGNTTRRISPPFRQHPVPTCTQHIPSARWADTSTYWEHGKSPRSKITGTCAELFWLRLGPGFAFLSFLLVSFFFKQEVDIGQSADAYTSRAVLDIRPSHLNTHFAAGTEPCSFYSFVSKPYSHIWVFHRCTVFA